MEPADQGAARVIEGLLEGRSRRHSTVTGREDGILGGMAVSPDDRARMERLTHWLREVETDEAPSEETLALRIAAANEWRARHDIPPLRDDDDPPELELFRRARALGLGDRRR
jgi:hypothetical protein